MFELDGRQGSGSGTIVRDAVVYAALTGETLRMTHIRARRRRPGLRPQHVTVVEAVARLCGGQAEGAITGSGEIRFIPGARLADGDFHWDIGTAGSAVMLAQTVLPVALLAGEPSRHTIIGGLFQDFAPTVFHFQQVLLATVQAMGVRASLEVIRPGYVPAGGGEVVLRVDPLKAPLRPLQQDTQGQLGLVRGLALSSLLEEREVSRRMAASCEEILRNAGLQPAIQVLTDTRECPAFETVSAQPGAALAIWAKSDTGCLLGADRAGAPGRRSEAIGQAVAGQFLQDRRTEATVDRYLGDQVIPFAALAAGDSRFRVPRVTDHIRTRLWLAKIMLGADSEVDGTGIRIEGIGKTGA